MHGSCQPVCAVMRLSAQMLCIKQWQALPQCAMWCSIPLGALGTVQLIVSL